MVIPRQKPNCFGHTGLCIAETVMFPSWNLSLLSSSLIITMIHVSARPRPVVLNGISKPQGM